MGQKFRLERQIASLFEPFASGEKQKAAIVELFGAWAGFDSCEVGADAGIDGAKSVNPGAIRLKDAGRYLGESAKKPHESG